MNMMLLSDMNLLLSIMSLLLSSVLVESTSDNYPRSLYGTNRLENSTDVSVSRSLISNRLYYWRGPLLLNVKVVLIYWGGSNKVRYSADLSRFYSAIMSSSWFNIMTEYHTHNRTIGSGKLITTYSDDTAPTGTTITAEDVESRLKLLITGKKVPPPDSNTYYAIHVAQGSTMEDQCLISENGTYCAHRDIMIRDTIIRDSVFYSVIPDQVGCGFCDSGNALRDILTTASLQLAAAITNPDLNTGWLDPQRRNVATKCLSNVGKTVGSDGETYDIQFLWSNKEGKCVESVAKSSGSSMRAGIVAALLIILFALILLILWWRRRYVTW
jgi:hypothetical protein